MASGTEHDYSQQRFKAWLTGKTQNRAEKAKAKKERKRNSSITHSISTKGSNILIGMDSRIMIILLITALFLIWTLLLAVFTKKPIPMRAKVF